MPDIHIPSLEEMLSLLELREAAVGLFLIGTGLVFMLLGLRIFHVTIAVSAGVFGFALAWQIPLEGWPQFVAGGIGALVLGLASAFLIKATVATLGGLWAGLAVAGLLIRLGATDQVALLVGIAGLAVGLSLTFILYEEIIAFITSLEGSLCFLGGLIICLSHLTTAWPNLRAMLTDNALFAPFFVISGTVVGYFVQMTEHRKKQVGEAG